MVAQIAEPIHLERVDWTAREIPADLSPAERSAYVRGYARGCHAYVKKNGGPGVVHDGPAPAGGTPERRALGIQLAELARAHEEERHPAAHRAGMSALRKYRKIHGIAAPVAPKRAPARKPRKLAAVPAVETAEAPAPAPAAVAPVVRLVPSEPAEEIAEEASGERANRTRKLARRELAEAMRARGEDPRDAAAWAAAKLAAGVK